MEVLAARYFMVHTVTLPLKDGAILVDGLQQKERAALEESEEQEPGAEVHAEDGEDLCKNKELRREEELSAEDLRAVDAAQQRWNNYIRDKEAVEVTSLTWAVPLASRKTDDIIGAAAQGYSRIRAMGIPVIRVHTDRAREFTSKAFRKWTAQRSLYTTYTAGDEPCGNARAEREVGRLKARIRVLIRATESPMEWWPLALRHAAEEGLREQLRRLGVPAPRLIAFGAEVVVKQKTWFHRGVDWEFPMTKARCYGPAGDMSLTSGGYVLHTQAGTWVRSTVVIEPRNWQALRSQRDAEDQQAADTGALGNAVEDPAPRDAGEADREEERGRP